ncbi:MAG TPA: hypothetical protein VGM77_07975 [Gemmatimonadales bacterium]|jgi:hypothetical protein
MKGWLAVVLIGVAAACGSLPDAGNGVVQLQLLLPDSLFLYPGESLTLRAQALDLAGNTVAAAPIAWRTIDTTLISLDSVTGVVTSLLDTAASARVQARSGTLVSDFVTIALRKDTTTSSLRAP